VSGKITMSVLSESQTGTLGNDWKYSLEVRIYDTGGGRALTGQGTISVPEHRLDSGRTQEPPGPPEALVLPAGRPGAEILVDMRLAVAEVDLVMNDAAETTASFKMTCPASGAPAVSEEREIVVSVLEQPSGVGRAVFRLVCRATLESD